MLQQSNATNATLQQLYVTNATSQRSLQHRSNLCNVAFVTAISAMTQNMCHIASKGQAVRSWHVWRDYRTAATAEEADDQLWWKQTWVLFLSNSILLCWSRLRACTRLISWLPALGSAVLHFCSHLSHAISSMLQRSLQCCRATTATLKQLHATTATLQRSHYKNLMSKTVLVLENTPVTRSVTESLPEVFLRDTFEKIY